jgi:hypothetical protein
MSTLQFPSTDINSRDAQIDLAEWIEEYNLSPIEAGALPGVMRQAAAASNLTEFQLLGRMMGDENVANMVVSICEELEVLHDHIRGVSNGNRD